VVRPLRDPFSRVAPNGPHRRHATRACTCTDKFPPPRSTIATSVMGQARELVDVDGQPLSSCNRQGAGKGFRRTPGGERGGARIMRTTGHCSKLETCLRGLAAAAGAFWLASVFAASFVNVDIGVAPELSFSGGLRVTIGASPRVAPNGPHRQNATRACTCTDKFPPPRSTIATSVMGQARELVEMCSLPGTRHLTGSESTTTLA